MGSVVWFREADPQMTVLSSCLVWTKSLLVGISIGWFLLRLVLLILLFHPGWYLESPLASRSLYQLPPLHLIGFAEYRSCLTFKSRQSHATSAYGGETGYRYLAQLVDIHGWGVGWCLPTILYSMIGPFEDVRLLSGLSQITGIKSILKRRLGDEIKPPQWPG